MQYKRKKRSVRPGRSLSPSQARLCPASLHGQNSAHQLQSEGQGQWPTSLRVISCSLWVDAGGGDIFIERLLGSMKCSHLRVAAYRGQESLRGRHLTLFVSSFCHAWSFVSWVQVICSMVLCLLGAGQSLFWNCQLPVLSLCPRHQSPSRAKSPISVCFLHRLHCCRSHPDSRTTDQRERTECENVLCPPKGAPLCFLGSTDPEERVQVLGFLSVQKHPWSRDAQGEIFQLSVPRTQPVSWRSIVWNCRTQPCICVPAVNTQC